MGEDLVAKYAGNGIYPCITLVLGLAGPTTGSWWSPAPRAWHGVPSWLPPSKPWQLSCPGALAAARGASPCLRAGFSANGSPLSTLPSVGLGRPVFLLLPPISELLLVGGKSQGCCPAQGKDGLEGSKKPGEVADVGRQLPLGKAGQQQEQIEKKGCPWLWSNFIPYQRVPRDESLNQEPEQWVQGDSDRFNRIRET